MENGISGKIAGAFIRYKLSILLMFAFMLLGIFSIYFIPREEEPQIEVPMADIMIGYPGATPQEVESSVVQPIEKIISNIFELSILGTIIIEQRDDEKRVYLWMYNLAETRSASNLIGLLETEDSEYKVHKSKENNSFCYKKDIFHCTDILRFFDFFGRHQHRA